MRKRRSRSIPVDSLLIPVNIRDFGSDNDPCFGKHHDLMAPECQACGDQEMCSIAFLAKMKHRVEEYESDNPVLDREYQSLLLKKEVQEYIESKIRIGGLKESLAHKMAMNKFKLTRSDINKIIQNGH